MPDFIAITATLFVLLVTVAVGNIKLSEAKSYPNLPTPNILVSPGPSPPAAVLSETTWINNQSTPSAEAVIAPVAKPKIVTIKITDGADLVNIRQKPTTASEKIGQAKDGDTFEFVSLDSGWYGVKLDSGNTGFISTKYIKTGEAN